MGSLGRRVYSLGFWIREVGQAIDHLGCRLQGKYYFQEQPTNYINLAKVHAAENAKPFDEIVFENALRKKYAHDSMLGVVRKTQPELVHPDSTLPYESQKAVQ